MATDTVLLDTVDLTGPAWDLASADPLYSTADYDGDDLDVPFRHGVLPRSRWSAGKRVDLQLNVHAGRSPAGDVQPADLDGLNANIDRLKLLLRPRQQTSGAAIAHHLANGTVREGWCVPLGLASEVVTKAFARVTARLWLPYAQLTDPDETTVTSASIAGGASGDVTVPHGGTIDQFATVLDLTGTASVVRVETRTWDSSGGTWVEFGGSLGGGVTVDCGEFTADRDGDAVAGLISHAGHPRWLPLLAGVDNTIRIKPTGGDCTATVRHYVPYA